MNLYRKKGIVFGMFVLLLRVMVFLVMVPSFLMLEMALELLFL